MQSFIGFWWYVSGIILIEAGFQWESLKVYPMGFGQGSAGLNGTGFQLLVILFMLLFGVTLGQMVAALSPSVQVGPLIRFLWYHSTLYLQVAVLFNPFIGIVLATFCGVTIPFPTMAHFWKSWLYQLDPYTRTLAAMVSTELQWVFHLLSTVCPTIRSFLVVWLSNASRMNSPCSILLRIKLVQLGPKTL